ncbi:MAG: hypothetical protein IJL05_00060 [Alphaproteobacteria bacterium]|nr:hypothetical protein [Alphaproteobacteria bacterium]
MKNILFFVLSTVACIFNAGAAVRDANTTVRGKTEINSTTKQPVRSISNRSAVKKSVSPRTAAPVTVLQSRSSVSNAATRKPVSVTRSSVQTRNTSVKKQNVSARAATQAGNIAQDTRTGAAYEQCKTAFFTCMDQFCQLKNDAFRRCSCNDRVFDFQETTETYKNVNERLAEFNENLDSVGLTKEQATAMKTATEGEDALAEDKSASKQLLQAIMNAIKGEDSTVGGKYQNLNSITISPDMSNAFGMNDYGQIIASYNGTNLYKAVYPKCRTAVKDDCNDASLQRAINAYLMAIEQDCNTVETALLTKQRELKASAYESSAMLDLARVENRQKHNSDDISTCLVNIETAIQSEEVCGSGYHKCLDNGQYIDVTTGAPLNGVQDFYKLADLLTFKNNQNIQNQKLSTLANNRDFVKFFENKTKKFAKESLDKCSENADKVWQEYLDRALLDIYYAQQSKVKTIKQSCFNLVAACYDNQSTAIAEAMTNLTGDYDISLKPATITLTQQICSDYIESCNNMFAGDIVKEYMTNKDTYDIESACRNIAKNCFDSFGGTNYENFYYLQNGVIEPGKAIDWFSLYEYEYDEDNNKYIQQGIVSPCAQELSNTIGCNDKDLLQRVFGGFDKYGDGKYYYMEDNTNIEAPHIDRQLRQSGIASEIYAQIIDVLSIQCDTQYDGFFVQAKYATDYGYKQDNYCRIDQTNSTDFYPSGIHTYDNYLSFWYHFFTDEDMCPANYAAKIDTQSWGMCSCWENGNRRSKNGASETCRPLLPITAEDYNGPDEPMCTAELLKFYSGVDPNYQTTNKWCIQSSRSSKGQICPATFLTNTDSYYCAASATDDDGVQAIKDQTLHNQ